MPVTFFDSSEPFPAPGIAEVDRVYRFAWQNFDDRTWEALDAVYRRLPGWRGHVAQKWPGWRRRLGRTYRLPFWFGSDTRSSPHLTASVEPPGLQVTGRLSLSDFKRWHEQFMAEVAEFPAGEPN